MNACFVHPWTTLPRISSTSSFSYKVVLLGTGGNNDNKKYSIEIEIIFNAVQSLQFYSPPCYQLFPTQPRPELRCSRWHWHKPSGRGKLAWMKSLLAHKAEVLERTTCLEPLYLTKIMQDGTQTIIHTTNCQNASARTPRAITSQYPGWPWPIPVWTHVNAKEHSSTLGWWHRPLVTWRFETALHWWSISQPHFGRILHRWGGRNPNWRARALGFRAGYFRIQDPEKQHQTNPGVDGLAEIIENLWMAFRPFFKMSWELC